MTVDVDLSRELALRVRPRPRDKNCFLNALRATNVESGAPCYYVEGFADGIAHGWAETEDGRVVEVTPTWLAKAPGVEYVRCRRFTARQLCDAWGTGALPVVVDVVDRVDRIRVAAPLVRLGRGLGALLTSRADYAATMP